MALVRDHYTCVHCGTMARVEVHHRVPVAEGGTDDLDNLEVCCPDCHKAEHRRLAAFEAE